MKAAGRAGGGGSEAYLRAFCRRAHLRFLPPEATRRVLDPLTRRLDVDNPLPVHAGLDPSSQKLAALHRPTGPVRTGDLARTVLALQRLASSARFRPWLYCIWKGRAELVYLHPHSPELDELRRWLERRPLTGVFEPTLRAWRSLPHVPVRIPLRVEALGP
jgi:hypothetical protein